MVSAANIAVKGEAMGMPTIAAVNVGALSNASPAQFVGVGRNFDAKQLARLSPEQRRELQQERWPRSRQ